MSSNLEKVKVLVVGDSGKYIIIKSLKGLFKASGLLKKLRGWQKQSSSSHLSQRSS